MSVVTVVLVVLVLCVVLEIFVVFVLCVVCIVLVVCVDPKCSELKLWTFALQRRPELEHLQARGLGLRVQGFGFWEVLQNRDS